MAWQRGDRDDAILATLSHSAANTHARAYVAWAWAGHDLDDAPIVILPIHTAEVESFAPAGPVRVFLRGIAAAIETGADIADLRIFAWGGMVGLSAPGLDATIFPLAWTEAHPDPARGDTAEIPDDVAVDSAIPLHLTAPTAPVGGLGDVSRQLRTHPVPFLPALMDQGWGLEDPEYPDEVVEMLRHRGFDGPEIPEDAPSLAIDDDPDPRRRIGRRLVRRLLHKGKIGAGYHTAFDHIAHGVSPADRAEAYRIGEALIRAGFLGEKPSVGQRHIYLRREALAEIHAFITSGETRDPDLAALWPVPLVAPREGSPGL